MASLLSRLYWTAFTAWHLLGQAHYPYRSPERIARDRDRNVRRIIRYAYRWVPYYRETLDRLGLTPRDFRTFSDLRKLPLISVADLQERPEAFRSTQFRDRPMTDVALQRFDWQPSRRLARRAVPLHERCYGRARALPAPAAHRQRSGAIAPSASLR